MYTCRVYKICNSVDNKEYVGSTKTSLVKRFNNHKSETRKNEKGMPLHDHMKSLGISKFHIELLEEKEVDNRKEQRILESEWQDKIKPELNKIRAYSSKEKKIEIAKNNYINKKEQILKKKRLKRIEDVKAGAWKCDCCSKNYTSSSALKMHLKEKTDEDKQKDLERWASYRENNREAVNQSAKKYKASHKEKISAYNKEYARKNNPSVTCDCGKNITRLKMKRHLKSRYHISRMESDSDSEPSNSNCEVIKYKASHKKERSAYDKELVLCECGKNVTRFKMKRHLKGTYHSDRINSCYSHDESGLGLELRITSDSDSDSELCEAGATNSNSDNKKAHIRMKKSYIISLNEMKNILETQKNKTKELHEEMKKNKRSDNFHELHSMWCQSKEVEQQFQNELIDMETVR